jgi:pyruvate dehydrogenase (quinone)
MPPHISLEQARAFATSVLKGDADVLGFLKQTAKEIIQDHLPAKK